MEFRPFPKIPRFNRDIVITEKIDGTNAQVCIERVPFMNGLGAEVLWGSEQEDGTYLVMRVGSRTRWIMPEQDNFGFAVWCVQNRDELLKLGEGSHFGEWWGKGIQRGYRMEGRKFSLFNTARWYDSLNHVKLCPDCCDVVPILYAGPMDQSFITAAVQDLAQYGSRAAPGYENPEGIIVYHTAANAGFKVTCKDDEKPKGQG